MIDQFKIINEGSIVLFEPLTSAAQDWWSSNVDPEAQTFGNAYAVEHRYAGDIVEGIKATSSKLQASSAMKQTQLKGKIKI